MARREDEEGERVVSHWENAAGQGPDEKLGARLEGLCAWCGVSLCIHDKPIAEVRDERQHAENERYGWYSQPMRYEETCEL